MEKVKRRKITVRISLDIIERIQNLCYWTPGISINSFVEESLGLCTTEFENQRGGKFPPRENIKTSDTQGQCNNQ